MADVRTLPRNAGTTDAGGIVINRVLRNTYLLLGMTLAFSAVVAMVAMATQAPYLGPIPTLVGFLGLLFLVHKTADSAWGLLTVFIFTGFLGYSLGPILNVYLSLPNGGALVGQAFGLTAAAFVGLSGYALVTRKDFSFLSGFLVVGAIVLLGAIVLSIFVEISGLQLAISSAMVLFASALILFETSNVIHGGETNYIRATVGLYVSIYNLFTSLLHLLGVFSGDD